MIFSSIEIQNFRQFYGAQAIDLTVPDPDRNIIVFHGYNGSGKTTLLNAFVWALYGETTPDLENPVALANDLAIAETAIGEEVHVSIKLTFKHHDEEIVIERRRISRVEDPETAKFEREELSLRARAADGSERDLGTSAAAKQRRIHQILPPDLHPFFLFNGERVERLASPDAYEKVESGIKTLLDVEIYERALTHSRRASRDLARELGQFGTDELRSLVDQQEQCAARVEESESRLVELRKEEARLDDLIQQIAQKQSAHHRLAAHTARREALEAEIRTVCTQLQQIRSSVARLLSTDGFLAFVREFPVPDDLVADRMHPVPDGALIHHIVASGRCVCGRPIDSGTPEHKALLALGSEAPTPRIVNIASKANRLLGHRRTQLALQLPVLLRSKGELEVKKANLEEDLDALSEQISRESVSGDLAELDRDYKETTRRLVETKATIEVVVSDLDEASRTISRIEELVGRLEVQEEQARRLKRQKTSVERVHQALQKIYEIQKENVRSSLDRQISEIWDDAAIKPYRASVTDGYRLQLVRDSGGGGRAVVGPSTGEKQVLALAFVGSLVRKAAQEQERGAESQLGFSMGGQYPLIMDSPFGSLEDEYREKVAEWVPRLARQIIVIVSKTQWRHEIEDTLQRRVARQFVLELHSPKQESNRTIRLASGEFAYVVSDSKPSDFTVVREVG